MRSATNAVAGLAAQGWARCLSSAVGDRLTLACAARRVGWDVTCMARRANFQDNRVVNMAVRPVARDLGCRNPAGSPKVDDAWGRWPSAALSRERTATIFEPVVPAGRSEAGYANDAHPIRVLGMTGAVGSALNSRRSIPPSDVVCAERPHPDLLRTWHHC